MKKKIKSQFGVIFWIGPRNHHGIKNPPVFGTYDLAQASNSLSESWLSQNASRLAEIHVG